MHASTVFYFLVPLVIGVAYRRMRMRARLPPGPPGIFMLGNLLDMPHGRPQWLTYKDWAEKFGDIISIEVFGTRMVTCQNRLTS